MLNFILVIPTFNCANQIQRVLTSMSKHNIDFFNEVLIIDNRSDDNTVNVAQKIIEERGLDVTIFQTKQNQSLGGTHKLAFDYAIQNQYDFIAILHGDDQAEIYDLLNMCKLASDLKYSILGSRFSLKSKRINYNPKRVVGNIVLNVLYSLRFLRIIKDLGSGINLFRTSQIEKINYRYFANSLTFNYELLISFIKNKEKFHFYPVTWKEEDQNSNAKNCHIFLTALKLLVINRRKYSEPNKMTRLF
jgi:dolichol-phosphate mannosyltransferase